MNENNKNHDARHQPRIKQAIKLKIKLPGFNKFIEKYSKDLSEGGIFIQLKDPKPVGSVIRFEFLEKDQKLIISGEGTVKWIRKEDINNPEKPPGMGIQFTKLTPQSKDLIKKIISGSLKRDIKDKVKVEKGEEDEKSKSKLNIDEMIKEAKELDTEKLDEIKTKGFFKEVVEDAGKKPKKIQTKEAPVIGIDLGTTNSCVAYVKDGKPYIISSSKGYRTIPSIVAYPGQSKIYIGHEAKAYFLTNPQNTIYGSKRMLGRKFKSRIIQEIKDFFKYKIVEGGNGDVVAIMDGGEIPLPLIASLILKEMKNTAEYHFSQKVKSAVITVPAHYSNRQRECVKEAGMLAGLEVKRIVNEPTAAALAYGLDKGFMEKVLIYDLGGGTFDVSVMEITNNVFEVLATGGDSFLGGIDFDNRILGYLMGKFKEKTEIDLQDKIEAMQRIKEEAENAKKDLSLKSTTIVNIPHICSDGEKNLDLVEELNRHTLEALTADLVNKTVQIMQEVMRKKDIKNKDINEILLVGGQTRMPLVNATLKRIFQMEPKKGIHPDEAVAMGAALLADSFDRVDSVVLLDSLSVPIGVGLPGGKFKEIIPKNTRIPFEKSYSLSTTQDNQESLDIDVFQGESVGLENCEYIGTFVFDKIPKASKGGAKIKLTFNLDSECILHLKAIESISGQVIEKDMIVKETPECIKQQFEKEKEL